MIYSIEGLFFLVSNYIIQGGKIMQKMPERATLTYDVDEILCDTCCEDYLFHLKKGNCEFTIGLSDIIQCLMFAEERGAVPKLDSGWWLEVREKYAI